MNRGQVSRCQICQLEIRLGFIKMCAVHKLVGGIKLDKLLIMKLGLFIFLRVVVNICQQHGGRCSLFTVRIIFHQ